MFENTGGLFLQKTAGSKAPGGAVSRGVLLFQRDHGDAALALAVDPQTEGFHRLAPPQDVVYRLSQSAGALAVDDGDGVQFSHPLQGLHSGGDAAGL